MKINNDKDLQKVLEILSEEYYSDSSNFDNYEDEEDFIYCNIDRYIYGD